MPIAVDILYRAQVKENDLLTWRATLLAEVLCGTKITSITMPGLTANSTLTADPQDLLECVMYALWMISPTLYAECEPDPVTYKLLH